MALRLRANLAQAKNKRCQRLAASVKKLLQQYCEESEGRARGVAQLISELVNDEERAELAELLRGDPVEAQQAQITKAMANIASSSGKQVKSARDLLVEAGAKAVGQRRIAKKATGLKIGKKLWRRARAGSERKKAGRKSRVDDPEVKQKVRKYLIDNSTETAHYMKLHKQMVQCRGLTRSKTRLWRQSPDMQALLSIDSFVRHLRKHHRQFVRYKKKVDVCPTCHKYDKLVVPKATAAIANARGRLLQIDGSYFEAVDKFWEEKLQSGKTDPVTLAQLSTVCVVCGRRLSFVCVRAVSCAVALVVCCPHCFTLRTVRRACSMPEVCSASSTRPTCGDSRCRILEGPATFERGKRCGRQRRSR